MFLATSIYPGRGGPGESLFYPELSGQAHSDEEDFQVEDEDDWMGDTSGNTLGDGHDTEMPVKLTHKHSKFSELVAAEAIVFFSVR